jgi:GT2 family glycosyltransferase/glycosyltransferase involved in cell wall biosynthesis
MPVPAEGGWRTGTAPLTRQEWLQGLTRDAWLEGQAAAAGGDLDAAAQWLERAQRLGPEDAAVALSLAALRLRRGEAQTALPLLEEILRCDDVREAWLSLAAARRALGRPEGAAAALASVLTRYALPKGCAFLAFADGVAASAGMPGWCGLRGDLRLVVRPARSGMRVLCDGQPMPGRQVPEEAGRVEVFVDDRPLLGNPIDVAAVRRVEGLVAVRDGGLEGWAWHPGNPDADPTLTIRSAGGRPIQIVASDTGMPAARPLARPRRFHVPATHLAGMDPPLRVTGRDGRDLLGSPLDPGWEQRRKAMDATEVARRFPFPGARKVTRVRPAFERAVAVVVPVHGGGGVTLACLDALLATLPAGCRAIVIDDASPDDALVQALQSLARQRRILLRRQEKNCGFPASANAGMRLAASLPGRPDVVLLNSDTLTPPGWLEALRSAVHGAADIGTATPLSNDATILSYPDPAGGNTVPDAAGTAKLGRLAAANAGAVVDIPTAVGFCTYVRRECLEQVGLFREDVFAQGYGEENDFCLRARALGWRHVAVTGTYVAHRGGQSFGAAGRQMVERNLDLLERLHPGYRAEIAAFQESDPLAPARRRIDMARWRAGRRNASVILVTHDSGGGVERVVRERAATLGTEGKRTVLLRPVAARDGSGLYQPGLCAVGEPGEKYPNLHFRLPHELPALARLLRAERPAALEVHHLLGHDHAVMDLAPRLGLPLDIHLHDYALFCPRITLVGREGRYCGEPEEEASCAACVADLGRNTEETIGIADLRRRSAGDLARARSVVVPSADMAARLRRHFPACSPVVAPLEDEQALPAPAPLNGQGTRHVCVVGAISTEKGYDVLLACARDAAARGLGLRFTVVGHTLDDVRLLSTGRAFVTGPYREEDAVGLIRAQGAQLAFLPSIWPETWCFTLGLAWRAGLAVAAFDLGAPAERIRRTGRGWLLPLGLPAPAINNALLAVRTATGDE